MSVQSPVFIAGVVALALVALAASAWTMGRGPRIRARIATALALLLSTLLATASMALVLNVGGGWVKTTGDVLGLVKGAASTSSGAAQSGASQSGIAPRSAVAPEKPQSDAKSADLVEGGLLPASLAPDPSLSQKFETDPATGELVAKVAGPVSGLTRTVRIWTPPDFAPNSQTIYDVMLFNHGFPGTEDGPTNALRVSEFYADLKAKGIARPMIFVIPDMSMEGAPPNCVDVEGWPKVETFMMTDVVRALRSTFSNLNPHREGWMLSGISAGGYCAPVLALRHTDTFLGAISMGGVDVPEFGPLAYSGPEVYKEFTLSTMLRNIQGPPVHMYFAGTKEEQRTLDLVTKVTGLGRPGDEIVPHLDETGGHSWTVWGSQLAAAMPWWIENANRIEQDRALAEKDAAAAAAKAAELQAERDAAAKKAKEEAEAAARDFAHPALFSMRGSGTIALWSLIGLAFASVCVAAGHRVRFPGARRGRHAAAKARDGFSAFSLRALLALATALALAVALLLVVNRVESFYTSWSGLVADLSVLL